MHGQGRAQQNSLIGFQSIRVFYAFFNRKTLELEIDKRLQVGGDELIDDEDDEGADNSHQRQGHLSEPNAITALEILGEPMDNQPH